MRYRVLLESVVLKHLPIFNLLYTNNPLWRRVVAVILLACGIVVLTLSQNITRLNYLDTIQKRGEIKVLTRNTPTTVYEGADGKMGFEYELLKAFADYLEVSLTLNTDKETNLTTPLLLGKSMDLSASGLSQRMKGIDNLNVGPSYGTTKVQIIYKNGTAKRPRNFKDIGDTPIAILEGYQHQALLAQYKQQHPQLNWVVLKHTNLDALIEFINEGTYTYALVESREFDVSRRYTPEVHLAFTLHNTQSDITWKTAKSRDDSLKQSIDDFFAMTSTKTLINNLNERYFGHLEKFDYVDKRSFVQHIETRLPLYKSYFMEAESQTNIDWRLLAAIGYQESHWQPNATSPTGVRGLMMLTKATAKEVGVKNRLNPKQSILGGAQYFKRMLSRIPNDVKAPDRTWFALAAYNVGFGHLLDARLLSERFGKNKSLWVNIKSALPLLSQKKYYSTVRHGYARGAEPVAYVNNIRDFYETLMWYEPTDNDLGDAPTNDTSSATLPTPFGL